MLTLTPRPTAALRCPVCHEDYPTGTGSTCEHCKTPRGPCCESAPCPTLGCAGALFGRMRAELADAEAHWADGSPDHDYGYDEADWPTDSCCGLFIRGQCLDGDVCPRCSVELDCHPCDSIRADRDEHMEYAVDAVGLAEEGQWTDALDLIQDAAGFSGLFHDLRDMIEERRDAIEEAEEAREEAIRECACCCQVATVNSTDTGEQACAAHA